MTDPTYFSWEYCKLNVFVPLCEWEKESRCAKMACSGSPSWGLQDWILTENLSPDLSKELPCEAPLRYLPALEVKHNHQARGPLGYFLSFSWAGPVILHSQFTLQARAVERKLKERKNNQTQQPEPPWRGLPSRSIVGSSSVIKNWW